MSPPSGAAPTLHANCWRTGLNEIAKKYKKIEIKQQQVTFESELILPELMSTLLRWRITSSASSAPLCFTYWSELHPGEQRPKIPYSVAGVCCSGRWARRGACWWMPDGDWEGKDMCRCTRSERMVTVSEWCAFFSVWCISPAWCDQEGCATNTHADPMFPSGMHQTVQSCVYI